MAVELLVLRLIHILGGVYWVGAGLFSTFYLAPALKASGLAVVGAVMGHMQKRHMFTVMPVVAILTMLSGIRLMMIVSGGDSHWFVHRAGHTYSVSGALAIIAFVTVSFGGFGSVLGALAAGLIIGVVESLSAYLIGPVYKDVVVYILFVLVLWFRPQGLMGKT